MWYTFAKKHHHRHRKLEHHLQHNRHRNVREFDNPTDENGVEDNVVNEMPNEQGDIPSNFFPMMPQQPTMEPVVPPQPEMPQPEQPQTPPVTLPQNPEPEPQPQDLLPPDEKMGGHMPSEPEIDPDGTPHLDPDVENSQSLKGEQELNVEQQEQNPIKQNAPRPPIHDRCHCEIITMPGGHEIWKTNGEPCPDCALARDTFNQS